MVQLEDFTKLNTLPLSLFYCVLLEAFIFSWK